MSEKLQISLNDSDTHGWDSFIQKHKASTFFHQIGWRNVVEKTYNHQPFYLTVRENGKIKGVLPLFLMKHILFGKFLISIPFCDYGGICADDEISANVLLAEAIRIAQDTSAKFLELRHIDGIDNEQLITKKSRANLILPLEKDSQTLWKSFEPKVRNQVRKAEKSGLKIENGDKILIHDFYDVYTCNMRDLGTPVHSMSFFENILTEFPDHTSIILVKLEDKTIGGAIVACFKETVEIPWASSLREFFSFCPNNLLYWATLEQSCLRGFKQFSFGRSPWNSGTFIFKKQWGARPIQLHYQYYLNKIDEIPDYTASTNPRFKILIDLWKKLPLNLTKIIGPKIIAGIPY